MFGRAAKKENEQLKQRLLELENLMNSIGATDIVQVEDYRRNLEDKIVELGAEQSAIQNEIRVGNEVLEMSKRRGELEKEVAKLVVQKRDILREIKAGDDALKIKKRLEEFKQQISQLNSQKSKIQTDIRTETLNLQKAKEDVINVRGAVTLQEHGLYDFEHPAEESIMLQKYLDAVRQQIKDVVRNKRATTQSQNFIFNNSTAKGRSFVNKMSKMALRSYNAEVENAITRMKAGSLDAAVKRVERAREQVQKMGDMIDLRITHTYHELRLKELTLASQHLAAKAAAKEAEREERAQLREEKKAQQEMEAERKRLEKERSHYENSIAKLKEQNRFEEIVGLEAQLNEINRGIEDVDYRAANVRAGYVYVISNIGSFGERMVKIGFTRRLDPMERVKELGDASVPFNFDVHVLHFSKDAVSVEAELHRKFDHAKVNLINSRREFFYATPSEVKTALLEIEGNVLEYEETPEAEQFRQSSALRKQPTT